ncbi:PH domain-containing protein [Georgenia satyanarayanai]|uniref:PH domain-containing protein n=1 Tax=Georgenia satyanarayanai TaxID=860221 RepID=UPI0012646161|nr:PH domain-containing protein [Georgenia satyanarayanai]
MQPAIVFRAAASRGYAVATWVVAAAVLAAFAVNGGVAEVLRYGALPLLLAALGWAAFWRPLVRVEPDGVRVANVITTIWLPWAAITGTRTRWGLEITTHDGKVGAWALPARSAIGRWTRARRDVPVVSSLHHLDGIEAGGADPDVVAGIVEEHRTGHLAGSAARPERHLEILPAALLMATAGLAIVSLLL